MMNRNDSPGMVLYKKKTDQTGIHVMIKGLSTEHSLE